MTRQDGDTFLESVRQWRMATEARAEFFADDIADRWIDHEPADDFQTCTVPGPPHPGTVQHLGEAA